MSEPKLIRSKEDYDRISGDRKLRPKVCVVSTGGSHKIYTVHGLSWESIPVYEGGQWVKTVKIKDSWYVQNLTIDKDRIAERIVPVCLKYKFDYYYIGDEMLNMELNQYNDPVYWTNHYENEKEIFISFGKYENALLNEETIKDDLDYFVYMVHGSGWKPKTEKILACLNYIREMPIVKNAVQREIRVEASKEKQRELKARKLAKKRAKSEYVGTTGQREELTLTIKKKFTFFSQYEDAEITGLKFEDDNENQLIYFNSFQMPLGEHKTKGFIKLSPEEGDIVTIKATIKKHEESESFGKTTHLSRIYGYAIGKFQRNQFNKKG